MNEIVLVGEVSSKIIKLKNNISTVYLKVRDCNNNKFEYIPVNFRNLDYDFLYSLRGKTIAISGHIESSLFNKIFVDIIKVLKNVEK